MGSLPLEALDHHLLDRAVDPPVCFLRKPPEIISFRRFFDFTVWKIN
jgi:hypothetical protein